MVLGDALVTCSSDLALAGVWILWYGGYVENLEMFYDKDD